MALRCGGVLKESSLQKRLRLHLAGTTIASAITSAPALLDVPAVEVVTLENVKSGPIVAVGEILWDLLPAGPRLGGTTANFATGCARLGRPAALISSLGEDLWGDRARTVLAETQRSGAALLDVSLIQSAKGVPTGLVEVQLGHDGQPTYSIAMPAAWDFITAAPEALSTMQRATAVCFGTLCQRSDPSRSAIRELIQSAPRTCLRVLDVNVRAPFFSEEVARWSIGHASVVKISDEELHQVALAVGVPGLTRDGEEAPVSDIERCGRGVLDAHPDLHLLAVTMGARGSLLLTPDDVHFQPGIPIEVVDTVGVGDAFTAGLVHAWLAGVSLSQVNEVGNLCGSFVASQPGATPRFTPELLEKIARALAD